MPSKKRERDLARARLERRAARHAAARVRNRRRTVVGLSTLVALAVIGAVAAIAVSSGGGSQTLTTPKATPDAGKAAATPAGCTYTRTDNGQGRTKDVGLPPAHDPATPTTMTIATNRGTLTVRLDTAAAPCTVNSFAFLASKNYFDNTPCHRLTTAGIYVLQCGDPFGTGAGGPGYRFGDENLGAFGGTPGGDQTVTYPAGAVAMANSGAGTNGSQFFIVYKASKLPPKYTPFGTVTSGLPLVEAVAKAGTKDGGGDGAPKDAVTITDLTLTATPASATP